MAQPGEVVLYMSILEDPGDGMILRYMEQAVNSAAQLSWNFVP